MSIASNEITAPYLNQLADVVMIICTPTNGQLVANTLYQIVHNLEFLDSLLLIDKQVGGLVSGAFSKLHLVHQLYLFLDGRLYSLHILLISQLDY